MEFLDAVPDWLKGLVTAVGAVLGIAVTAVIAKLGAGSGTQQAQEEKRSSTKLPPELVGYGGALLDMRSAQAVADAGEKLSASLEALHTVMREAGDRSDKAGAARMVALTSLVDSMKAIAAGVTKWNDWHEQEKEERDKREKDRIERENDQLKRDLREATRRSNEGAHHGSSTSSSLSFDNKG